MLCFSVSIVPHPQLLLQGRFFRRRTAQILVKVSDSPVKRLLALLLVLTLLLPLLPAAAAADDVKVAAFTFDDGPHRTITPALLDGLAERGVRATFFVNGANAEHYPDIVLRAAAEGHQIANHTYSHSYLNKMSADKVRYEVSRTENYLQGLVGKENFLVRVPYGGINDTVKSVINVPIMMWSVDPTSGRVMSAAAMRDGIVRTAHDGAIILLHDTSQANLDAALQSIDILVKQGYVFVTLDELFAIKGITPKGGTVYRQLTGENVIPFFDGKDISTHWAWKDIQIAEKAGVMVGDGNSFRPEWGMTRAEAVMVLYRMANASGTYPAAAFEDVKPGDWFAEAVAWAVAEGVTQGVSDTRFDPTGYVTKEQFYTLFARYILSQQTAPGIPADAEIGQAAVSDDAPDSVPSWLEPEPSPAPLPELFYQPVNGDETASAWAKDSITQLRIAGFVSAAPAPRFYPKAGITRAETAELIAWYLQTNTAPMSSEKPVSADPTPDKPEPVLSAASLDDAVSSVLRDQYRSDVPDGLIRLQCWQLLATETIVGEPRVGEPSQAAVQLEIAYLMVYHAAYSMYGGDAAPTEVESGFLPTAITFSVEADGSYTLKDYWTPRSGADYESDILLKFPGEAAADALNPAAYTEILKNNCLNLLNEYINRLNP